MNISKEELIELGLSFTAIGASLLLKKLLEGGYEKVYKEEPPNAVKDEEIDWARVAGWTIISGLTATAVKVLVKRYGAQRIDEIE